MSEVTPSLLSSLQTSIIEIYCSFGPPNITQRADCPATFAVVILGYNDVVYGSDGSKSDLAAEHGSGLRGTQFTFRLHDTTMNGTVTTESYIKAVFGADQLQTHFLRTVMRIASEDGVLQWTFGLRATTGTDGVTHTSDDDAAKLTLFEIIITVVCIMMLCVCLAGLVFLCVRRGEDPLTLAAIINDLQQPKEQSLYYNANTDFSLAVRERPCAESPLIPNTIIRPNERVVVCSTSDGWCKIQPKPSWGNGTLKEVWARKIATDSKGVNHAMLKPCEDGQTTAVNEVTFPPYASAVDEAAFAPLGSPNRSVFDRYIVTDDMLSPTTSVHYHSPMKTPGVLGRQATNVSVLEARLAIHNATLEVLKTHGMPVNDGQRPLTQTASPETHYHPEEDVLNHSAMNPMVGRDSISPYASSPGSTDAESPIFNYPTHRSTHYFPAGRGSNLSPDVWLPAPGSAKNVQAVSPISFTTSPARV